ncbi:hypothetical protein [Microbacterium thalli]|uniref:hypothetical protein n=1 Tax=Microbacterium thalli TaxID=3027921 RepID=UPI00236646A7|nr:hypothetical protein [Microbacterium thalli]MDD7929699.1 hypothetical protein [Microbacterium thalli]
MEWLNIDVPNLLAGAVLGFVLSLPLVFHERAERRRDLGVAWTGELRQLEPLLHNPSTTFEDFYSAASAIQVDHYRRYLGPDDFRLLEATTNAFLGVQHNRDEHTAAARAHYERRGVLPPDNHIHNFAMMHRLQDAAFLGSPNAKRYLNEIQALHADPEYLAAEQLFIEANKRLRKLRVDLMNRGRERSRNEYDEIIRREARAENRRHPLRWARRKLLSWRRSRKH